MRSPDILAANSGSVFNRKLSEPSFHSPFLHQLHVTDPLAFFLHNMDISYSHHLR